MAWDYVLCQYKSKSKSKSLGSSVPFANFKGLDPKPSGSNWFIGMNVEWNDYPNRIYEFGSLKKRYKMHCKRNHH